MVVAVVVVVVYHQEMYHVHLKEMDQNVVLRCYTSQTIITDGPNQNQIKTGTEYITTTAKMLHILLNKLITVGRMEMV